jgi:hypothetical protein
MRNSVKSGGSLSSSEAKNYGKTPEENESVEGKCYYMYKILRLKKFTNTGF